MSRNTFLGGYNKISHTTSYKYNPLFKTYSMSQTIPSICENQEILEWKISSNFGKIIESHIDALGHRVQNIFINNLCGKLKITSEGIVNTKNLSGIVKGLNEKVNPICFLRETKLTEPCKKIKEILEQAGEIKDQIEFTHKLNLIVSNSIEYVSGSTTTSTSSTEALRQKKGVCQDFVISITLQDLAISLQDM